MIYNFKNDTLFFNRYLATDYTDFHGLDPLSIKPIFDRILPEMSLKFVKIREICG